MRCRRIAETIDSNNQRKRTIVWFGSYGKDANGKAKFVNPSNKHDNFSDGQEGIKNSLIQRLSVIRSELWYNVSYGLPLLSQSKLAIDSALISIVLSHPDVDSILNFESNVENHKYRATLIVKSKFGVVDITV